MYAYIFAFIQSNVYNDDDSECTDLQFHLTLLFLILLCYRCYVNRYTWNLDFAIINKYTGSYLQYSDANLGSVCGLVYHPVAVVEPLIS